MKHTDTYKEAKRLHGLGFAIHWLHPKSKRPIESGWTTGPRKDWEYLKETYIEGLNLGVRLGSASKIKRGFLAVIDVDVKSEDKRHRLEAVKRAKDLLGSDVTAPVVMSGRGNGSRHYYVLTASPFKTFNPAASEEFIKVHMPSKKPSKRELSELTQKEIDSGIRISRAWEVSLYSDGRQVVLPPSIHPDSGKPYLWHSHLTSISDLPVIEVPDCNRPESDREAIKATERSEVATLEGLDFKPEPVELAWIPISDEIRDSIIDGKNVEDRSGFLLRASTALISAGLTQNEVLTVLTDKDTFLGACAYDHAKTKNQQKAVEWLYKYTFKKVSKERDATSIFAMASPVTESRKLTEAEIEAQNEEFAEARHWTQDLEKTVNGVVKPTIQNVVLVLTNAVGEDIFKRNDFAFRDAYGIDTPWGGKKDASLTDDDTAKIRLWLGVNYGFEPKKETIFDAMVNIACENSFDPVMDMLGSLPTWDGTPRLDTWLADHFEAEGDPEYLAQVFRKWMVAMIMRVYEPGSKFDWMPIFEGAQGVGKSSFGRLLCGDKYFLDWLPNLADKDAALALQGMWVIEMGELSQFRKNEMEVIKGFITRTVDKVRPPFGRRWLESARRCVFFGTTNREKYLRDDTGNRRLKPVKVGSLDFDSLRKDRAQMFAEAKHLWDQKIESERTLDLTGKARKFEAKIHAEKMVEDDAHTMVEQIQNFIDKMIENEDFLPGFEIDKFRILELFQGVGPLHKWRFDNRNSQFAAKALKLLGCERRTIKGLYYWKMPQGGGLDDSFLNPPPTLDATHDFM